MAKRKQIGTEDKYYAIIRLEKRNALSKKNFRTDHNEKG